MIKIIAAIGNNNEIGANNKLLWYLKNDIKRFKELTLNNVVIMGRKTYQSLPIKPLPNRINIVLTTKSINCKTCIILHDIKDAIKQAKSFNKDIYIIGGEIIYKQFMKYADYLYITKIDAIFNNADSFFPHIDNNWKLISDLKHQKNKENKFNYRYQIYKKI